MSCAQNGPDAAVGSCSTAPREPFLLSRLAAQGNPNPGVVRFFEHKRPELIQFQDGGRGIFGIRSEQSGPQRRKLSYFFLIQLETVVRETPKVRVLTRKLLRS